MRRKTISVEIGNIVIGSSRPVMIQSMLNTPTMDTQACIEQSVRIIEAGGQLVRITAQGVKEAENLKNIHAGLRARGYDVPISADIHFVAEAALVAARYVEKVRINPGNFVDKRATFEELTYTDEKYAVELEKLEKKFLEFLQVCRVHKTAVRIGTNHGSLSDRVMSRYGDTPAGMVEATMEYLRICKKADFRDVVISLKSSDCGVMVDAVRLLAETMKKEEMDYPLHLGVTEAGEGEDGRIRSAVGIGTLLNEGIGDTIRVSLTEAPEAEIPVARMLTEICSKPEFEEKAVLRGDCTKPVIVADLSGLDVIDEKVSSELDFRVADASHPVYGKQLKAGLKAPEIIYTEALGPELTCLPETITVVVPLENIDMAHVYNRNAAPLCSVAQYMGMRNAMEIRQVFVRICSLSEITSQLTDRLKKDERAVVVLSLGVEYGLYRQGFACLQGIISRILIHLVVPGTEIGHISLMAASQIGGFFLDRLASGLWVSLPDVPDYTYALALSRNILQSAGVRRYKAEFVSCPGCGRTLFDLQGAVAKVKEAFGHLNTLKIAVMGCVVNGPGEMGDADYGYVGAGNGKVNLYKGRTMVKVAVPEEQAIEALRELIRKDTPE